MHTPFFPAFRPRLAALGHRVQQLRHHSLHHLDRLFGPWLPPGLLSQAEEGPNSRDRIYNLRRTFFGFLYQVLNPACSCRQVVRQIQALLGGAVDEGTGAWCQARARLPEELLSRMRRAVATRTEQAAQLWCQLRVKVIDGTSTSAPDTPANQKAYPQPGAQQPGCGFPVLKLVGVFCLFTGVLLDYAKGNKHHHELNLFQSLLELFGPGDLALADRGFNCYTLMAQLRQRGAHGLFRLHHRRPEDFRRGRRLGKEDRLVVWRKPQNWQRPAFLSPAVWDALPAELTVRLVRFALKVPGFRTRSVTLVTTLLDAQIHPAEELARLYARRWRIELWFRDLKTSMGMETLRCKSPAMLHKELEMFFVAYNFIRALMAEAAIVGDVPLERLSFKGTVDSLRQFSVAIAQARTRKQQRQLIAQLLHVIAADPVPERPGRREPRAVKRRPKPFQLLNRPRHQMKELRHRSKYRKNRGLI